MQQVTKLVEDCFDLAVCQQRVLTIHGRCHVADD